MLRFTRASGSKSRNEKVRGDPPSPPTAAFVLERFLQDGRLLHGRSIKAYLILAILFSE